MKRFPTWPIIAMLLLPIVAQSQPPAAKADGNTAPKDAPKKEKPAPEAIGFTWWNDVPEMIRRGNQEYKGEEFKNAEDFYRDAQLKNPEQAEAAFNIGLSEAKQGNNQGAASEFNRALNLAGADAALRAKTLYNLGSAHLNDALKLLQPEGKDGAPSAPGELSPKVREEVVHSALSSIEAYNGALKLNPNDSAAKFNKAQAQHLLQFASQPPPKNENQQQQNQQNQEQNQKDQQQQQNQQQNQQDQNKQDQQPQQPQPKPQDPKENNKDQQQQPQPDKNDKNEEQKQDAGRDEQKKDDSNQGNQQDENKPADQKPQDGDQQQGGASEQKPMDMTEDQARELLNLLGDQQNIVLRKGSHPYNRNEPKKDW